MDGKGKKNYLTKYQGNCHLQFFAASEKLHFYFKFLVILSYLSVKERMVVYKMLNLLIGVWGRDIKTDEKLEN